MFIVLAFPLSSAAEINQEERLDQFFADVFAQHLQRHPMHQSTLGIKDNYDQWDDISEAFAAESLALAKQQLAYMEQHFDYDRLNRPAQLSYRLFQKLVADHEGGYQWRHHSFSVNQMFGLHSEIPSFLINIHRIDTPADAKAYIKRLRGIRPLLRQLISNLELSESKGILPPAFVYPHALGDIDNILRGAPFEQVQTDSPLLADFKSKITPLEISAKHKQRLIRKAHKALLKSVQPAYLALAKTLREQQSRATESNGVWRLPNGEQYYSFRLKEATSSDLSAEEVHQYGLDEIKRIHGEMIAIARQVGFSGSLQDFFHHVRTHPRFYYPETVEGKAAYLQHSVNLIEQMKQRLNEVFNTLPKADIAVKAVEPYREKSAGWAFYKQPALDGSRPGIFYVNLYRMSDNPKYSQEALAYHEGIPGHHMQIAIAQELKSLPKFRTEMMNNTAFVEGWALYSEYLPKEMGGFYQDPYADFGRLSMELWRAIRLVVDTGLHAFRWSREQAIEFQVNNAPAPREQAVRSAERYLVLPGQATAYKIGMREILDLRAMAKAKLGDQFDLREFHDVVLGDGPLPLPILREQVIEWIKTREAL